MFYQKLLANQAVAFYNGLGNHLQEFFSFKTVADMTVSKAVKTKKLNQFLVRSS